jgi:hypothetical protein
MVEHLLPAISAAFLAFVPQIICPAIHQLLMFCVCVVYVIVFHFLFMFFWVILLDLSLHVHSYNVVWILVTQCTPNITFTGDPGFVVSVPQTIEPASSEALSPRIFILSFNFELSNPSIFSFL